MSELTPLQSPVLTPARRPPQRLAERPDAALPADGFTATTQLSAPPQKLLAAPEATPAPPEAPPQAPPATQMSYGLVPTEVPITLPIEVAPALETSVAPTPQKLAYDALCDGSHSPSKNLGPGFPLAPGPDVTVATRLHDLIAGAVPGVYATATDMLLSKISDATEKGAGLHVKDLLQVERSLYQALSHSQDGFVGGAAPLFQSLAEGQAAYVELGKELHNEADHLMRLYAGIPLDVIEATGHGTDHLADVRRILLERAKKNEFPVYVDVDGNFNNVTPTESIAAESIASIAKRENSLGDDFPDPRQYYKWLVTRVESSYRRLDPWLYAVSPEQHHVIGEIKDNLAPPWLRGKDKDPLGSRPHPEKVQESYQKFMKLCGDGQPPTMQNLADIADLAVQMDRDLISGIQSFWIKLLSEVSPEQRKTLMTPLARTWVTLNALPNGDDQFNMVSPANAPYIELIDKNTGKVKLERYDRAMAASETVDHTLDGLGLQERKAFIKELMHEIRSRKDAFEAREERLRTLLGDSYRGLDIEGILCNRVNGDDPQVQGALADLKKVLTSGGEGFNPMTPERAEIMRHRDIIGWVANKSRTYGDVGFDLMNTLTGVGFDKDPLIVGEFYTGSIGPVTDLPPGPSQELVLGTPVAGQKPVHVSQVFEGGGGKGNAYVEALQQYTDILSKGPGQVAIDEFVGNSAGAITAFFLASGFSPEEVKEKQKQIEFSKFYSDYLWLSGGVDPKVRGVDRTGLFSTQKMYKTLSEIVSEKVSVTGRPVLFRDLPFKLKVTATVLNTDMPQELKDRLGIDKDGQIVFSAENTPNMDVVAAVCASASVPGFFNAPQIQLAQKCENGKPVLHRMQLVDGGVVNNYPVSEATRDPNGKGMLVQVPVSFQAPNPAGGDPISLSTLEFQPQNLKAIDDFNRERIQRTSANLGQLFAKARQEGCERVVMGFNLSDMDSQTQPAVVGESKALTKKYVKLAQEAGVDSLSAAESRSTVEGNQKADKSSHVLQMTADWLLDKDGTFKHNFFGDPEYHPRDHEAHGMSDMIAGVAAASLVAPYQHPHRRFENRETA